LYYKRGVDHCNILQGRKGRGVREGFTSEKVKGLREGGISKKFYPKYKSLIVGVELNKQYL